MLVEDLTHEETQFVYWLRLKKKPRIFQYHPEWRRIYLGGLKPGEVFAIYRFREKRTRAELGRDLGVNGSQIARWERGEGSLKRLEDYYAGR